MNTKQAKRIKKEIYRDLSARPEGRKYERFLKTGQIINHPQSPRAWYQAAKKAYKRREI